MKRRQAVRRPRRSGVALIFVVAMFMAAVSIVGLAVDTTFVGVVAQQLQDGADAAALAAARDVLTDPDLARFSAIQIAAANEAANDPIILTDNPSNSPDGDIVMGLWDRDTRTFTVSNGFINAVRVVARRNGASAGGQVPLLFGSIFGVPGINVNREAVAEFGSEGTWDIFVVQDTTGSFDAEINDAREADTAVLGCVSTTTNPDSRIGIAQFNGFANLLSPLRPAESVSLQDIVDDLETCSTDPDLECTGTNISAGLELAIDQLVANRRPGASQAIILVGDGRPEQSGNRDPFISTPVLRQMAIDSAARAASEGIIVFTVLYNQDNVQAEADFLASLATEDGAAFDTPDSEELPDLMIQICSLLPRVPTLVR